MELTPFDGVKAQIVNSLKEDKDHIIISLNKNNPQVFEPYKINVNTLEHEPAKNLQLNEVGVCNLSLGRAISFDPYAENRATGNFILVDRMTNATVAAGMTI